MLDIRHGSVVMVVVIVVLVVRVMVVMMRLIVMVMMIVSVILIIHMLVVMVIVVRMILMMPFSVMVMMFMHIHRLLLDTMHTYLEPSPSDPTAHPRLCFDLHLGNPRSQKLSLKPLLLLLGKQFVQRRGQHIPRRSHITIQI